MSKLKLNDIQGNILLAYNMPVASYSFVRFHRSNADDPAEATRLARRFVGEIARWVSTAELLA